jgi:hypothetical protein
MLIVYYSIQGGRSIIPGRAVARSLSGKNINRRSAKERCGMRIVVLGGAGCEGGGIVK